MKKLSLLLVLLSLVGLNLVFAGVQMSSFVQTIDSVNSKVIFEWTTSSETNSYGFLLEWNCYNEPGNWLAIPDNMVSGRLRFKSPDNGGASYSYECALRSTYEGNTYRLKQIDNDATLAYYYPTVQIISVPPVIEPPVIDPPVDTTSVPPVIDPPVDTTSVPPIDTTTTPPTSSVEDGGNLPNKLHLSANYPNPFNPSTHIQFSVPKSGYVSLKVYNVVGQEVATLYSGNAIGTIVVKFDGSKLASGVYFARIEYNGKALVQRMLMTK